MPHSLSDMKMDWPYTVDYEKENFLSCDVLILGGGIAGCHAAITAARKGAKVIVVDKGAVVRSGSGGAGVDHWHAACTNPCSRITPEEMVKAHEKFGGYYYGEYGNGITCYIQCKEGYDTLLDLERMGVKIRDEDDAFIGAEFRDDKSKFMFAYDYENRHCLRVCGGDVKVALYKELKSLDVTICDYIMVTKLLTEDGRQGGRVVGATGINVRTGEFNIFSATTTIISMGPPSGLWVFSTELIGNDSKFEPNLSGEGTAMAWQAGAEMTMLERSCRFSGGFKHAAQGTGNAHNTWYACTIVDANGKEVPWVDRDGNILQSVSERYRPAPGQDLFIVTSAIIPYEFRGPTLIPDLPERIRKGEFVLPLYADLPAMPKHERRAIWGLMIGNEGRTRIPIYDVYSKAGFDPDKDMLQVNVMSPEAYVFMPWWISQAPPQWRDCGFVPGGGLTFDWNLKSSLEGLYVAGQSSYAGGNHSVAATSGRYAARNAVNYAKNAEKPLLFRKQIDDEKERVYAPVKRQTGIGWKELQAGLCRIMQDYCGEHKSEKTLQLGLQWLKSIQESEASEVCANNPHELARTLECFSRLTVGEIIMQASLKRKASSRLLDFKRIDFPENDPEEWNKLITLKMENGTIREGELPLDYHLLPPYSAQYQENYDAHSHLS